MRKALLVLPLLALAGCGSTLGGLGLSTAGSASFTVTHKQGCPDIAAQGAIPLMGLELGCIFDPATGRTSETAKLQSSDPTTIIAQNNALLTGVVGQLIGIGKAVGTGGLAGVAMPNGSATAMPYPGVQPGPGPLIPPRP